MSFRRLRTTGRPEARRDFMTHSAFALLGLGAMPRTLLAGTGEDDAVTVDPLHPPLRPATARSVIYLYLSGGLSHLDSFDPKPGAETQGPVESISTSAGGLRLSQYFPQLAGQAHNLAVVRSMNTTQGAHAQGRYFMHTSYEPRGTIRHPSIGSWLLRMAGPVNPALPPQVEIGGDRFTASSGFFPAQHGPLPLGDPNAGLQNATPPRGVEDERHLRRLARLQEMNQDFADGLGHRGARDYVEAYGQAVRLMESEELAAFDLDEEPDRLRDAYGRDRFGQGCLLARRLVERDVRFVEVVSGGWDTHNDNFEAFETRGRRLDRSLAALLADLEARGLLEETLVVVTTEFGRTPDIVTERMGRNHYPRAFSALLAGGGIAGGRSFGETDAEGREIVANPVSVPDFNATIATALGLPLDQVLHSPSGRPFTVAHKGQPVMELFA